MNDESRSSVRHMGSVRNVWRAQIGFAWRKKREFVIILVAIAAAAIILWNLRTGTADSVLAMWNSRIDPAIGIITLLIAGFIWLSDFRVQWLSSLPMRFDVIFNHSGKLLMMCRFAHVSDESDLRPLGQSIGAQLIAAYTGAPPTRQLQLRSPAIRYQHRGAIQNPFEHQHWCNHYVVTFELQERPAEIQHLDSDSFLLWEPPFERVVQCQTETV